MATTLYFQYLDMNDAYRWASGTNFAEPSTANKDWDFNGLLTSRSTVMATSVMHTTVSGTTLGYAFGSGARAAFVSAPITSDVTISGSITLNLWAYESSMSANATIGCRVAKVSGTTGSITVISDSGFGAELGTSYAAKNWSASPSSTSLYKGDRIMLIPFVQEATGLSMGAGYTVYFKYAATSSGAEGDSYVTFNETISFAETMPSGTTLYLTSTDADVNPNSVVAKNLALTAPSAATVGVRNTANGYTVPLQWTATAGGTVLEFFSKPLGADFTLGSGGFISLTLDAYASTYSVACWRVELAVVSNAGTSPTVYGVVQHDNPLPGSSPEAYTAVIAGPDISVTSGQRVRVRLYIDDYQSAMVASRTATLRVGPDNKLVFGQSLAFEPITITPSPFTLDAVISNVWGWKSPPDDGAGVSSTPTFTFITPDPGVGWPMFFQIELDTSSSFNTGNLVRYQTGDGQGTWEYYDGSTWVSMPSSGMPEAYKGNDARFTAPTLANGLWYRRLRHSVR